MWHQRTAREGSEAVSQELFRSRFDALIDLSYPLAKLSRVMPGRRSRTRIEALPSVATTPNDRWATDLCRVWAGRVG